MDTTAVLDVEFEQDIDVIEEMQLRTWARQHYIPPEDRDDDIHPVILDEMLKKDLERR